MPDTSNPDRSRAPNARSKDETLLTQKVARAVRRHARPDANHACPHTVYPSATTWRVYMHDYTRGTSGSNTSDSSNEKQ